MISLDAMVVSILLYCFEVWGIYNFTDVDKIHIRLCKNILGVKQMLAYMVNWVDIH